MASSYTLSTQGAKRSAKGRKRDGGAILGLGHPGDVHFGLLKPISFIPWLRRGLILTKPKGGAIAGAIDGAIAPNAPA